MPNIFFRKAVNSCACSPLEKTSFGKVCILYCGTKFVEPIKILKVKLSDVSNTFVMYCLFLYFRYKQLVSILNSSGWFLLLLFFFFYCIESSLALQAFL